ncbi:MAG: glycerol kinase GlpK, partial [Hungatella sp.]
MNKTYVIGIDQSTQGTKALLFDGEGRLLGREDLPHRQIVNERGLVEHDPEEIYQNSIAVVKNLIEHQAVSKSSIAGIGISNQRETALAWERESGIPIYNAIVWQCARGEDICKEIKAEGYDNIIREHTGLPLSPYFSAAKLSWIMRRVAGAQDKNRLGKLCCGTMDSWLIYRLTGKKEFKTDYSNASRTQLFNLTTLSWDTKLCQIFGINPDCLAQVCDSDAKYGMTDLEGYLPEAVPIHGVLGDSHGALFGQGCIHKGMIKTTYGTGSSVMMNVGEKPVFSSHGAASSLAWCMGGKVNYVLEGNINYTGAVITWLIVQLQLISNASEAEGFARKANPLDTTYLVPAFSGLGAPYWDSMAQAMLYGMTRTTGKAEIVKAALESIAYQIADVVLAMKADSGIEVKELRVDGGPTKNTYLMQFQSDLLKIPV